MFDRGEKRTNSSILQGGADDDARRERGGDESKAEDPEEFAPSPKRTCTLKERVRRCAKFQC